MYREMIVILFTNYHNTQAVCGISLSIPFHPNGVEVVNVFTFPKGCDDLSFASKTAWGGFRLQFWRSDRNRRIEKNKPNNSELLLLFLIVRFTMSHFKLAPLDHIWDE